MSNDEKVSKSRQNEIRKEYNDEIRKNIQGPGSERINFNIEREVITENPKNRYVTGILYPKNEKNNHSGIDEELDHNEEAINVDNSFLPSSLGMTFYCEMERNDISLNVTSSYYEKEKNPNIGLEETDYSIVKKNLNELTNILEFDDKELSIKFKNMIFDMNDDEFKIKRKEIKEKISELKNLNENVVTVSFLNSLNKIISNSGPLYCRHPLFDKINISFENSDIFEIPVFEKVSYETNENVKIELFAKRQKISNTSKVYAVTIVLKNICKKPEGNALFQTELEVNKQESITFKSSEDIDLKQFDQMNESDQMNLFLYRKKKTYAFGKGVSVEWKLSSNKIDQIKTTYLPSYEILPMSFDIPELKENKNSILKASSYIHFENKKQIIDDLNTFINSYEKWINTIDTVIVENEFEGLKKDNISKCRDCLKRMRKTVTLIGTDDNALRTFTLSNEAMILQRSKDAKLKNECYENNRDYSLIKPEFQWRPFQLAFILMSFESIVNDKSIDRDILDLIWVSTGGGKTEAYLFAIASTIIYRRLTRKKDYHGVNVIMRYTLRLLTSQQFKRASQLIVALEFLRRKNGNDALGSDEISIGMWIGNGTEYSVKGAKSVFNEMIKSRSLKVAKKLNHFQVLECPWCGTSLIPTDDDDNWKPKQKWGYSAIERKDSNYNICCVNKQCEYYGLYNEKRNGKENGLPVYVVDQSVYEKRPTLLFGTVDKFAQVPLKEEAQNLFGSDDVTKYGRPDLIIQDELHLISGPLGSIVGLYEAGFDYILHSGRSSKGPKYIASTATIKNANQQVKNIFNRKVSQFPPSGIDASNNFFVRENTSKGTFGRKYIGVMATGKTQVTTEVRLIATMLQAAKDLHLTDIERDIYWTTTGYFNSIRELGKASGLISDDVKEYINKLKEQHGKKERVLADDGSSKKELTSRIDSSEIPETLKKLDKKYSKENNEAIDILIATNMLSVGIDIGRLNAMFVVGQPKLNSEYIQATSRVGRNSLGDVYTLYNSTRSRDRSHYETFQAYHQNLYKFVESSSVTPYSEPALRKAIAAVMVMMIRNTNIRLSGNDSAINLKKSELINVKGVLLDRLKASPDSYLYLNDANKIISEFIDKFEFLIKEVNDLKGNLFYYLNSDQILKLKDNDRILLKSFEDRNYTNEDIDKVSNVMNSMRNVEDNSYLSKKESRGLL